MANQSTFYSLYGRISDQQNNPLENLIIHAFNKTSELATADIFLGNAKTNEKGRYYIRLEKEQFNGINLKIYIRVFDADLMLKESPIKSNSNKTNRIIINLKVDKKEFKVSGVVCGADKRPRAGCIVKAFDRDLRKKQPLGEGKCDEKGFYEIAYSAADFIQAEKSGADLLIQVFDDENATDTPLAESPIRFQAGPVETVNLIVLGETPASEFDLIVALLTPLLDGVKLYDLNRDNCIFLAQESGIAAIEIEAAATACRMEQQTQFKASAFYGYNKSRRDKRTGAIERFWRSLKSAFEISNNKMERFRFAAQAGEIVQYDLPLVKSLIDKQKKKDIIAAIDLALWDSNEWLVFIKKAWGNDNHEKIPAWTKGETPEEKQRYAAAFYKNRATKLFPPETVSGRLVTGQIHTPLKHPARGVAVQAFHIGFDKEIPVSPKVRSDSSGSYQIAIDSITLRNQLLSLGKLPLQLQVKVLSSNDEEEIIGRSAVIPHAALPITLNIALETETGPTEFEIVTDRFQKVIGKTKPDSIKPDKLRWLAGAAGIGTGTAWRYITAHKIAKKVKLSPEILYGILHPDVQKTIDPQAENIENILNAAVAMRIIRKNVLNDSNAVKAVEDWLAKRAIDERVKELTAPALEGQPVKPVDILNAAGLSQKAVDAYYLIAAENHDMDPVELDSELKRKIENVTINEQDLATIRRVRRLTEIIGPNAKLVGGVVKTLKSKTMSPEDDEIAIAELAKWSAADWEKKLNDADAMSPSSDDESPKDGNKLLARKIEASFEQTFPRQALLGRLEEADREQKDKEKSFGKRLKTPDYQKMLKFFIDNNINISGKGLKFQKIDDAAPDGIERDLHNLQRLSRIASYRDAIALLEEGYMSVRGIAAMPRESFIRQLLKLNKLTAKKSFRDEASAKRQAIAIHRRAKHRTAATLAIATALTPETQWITPAPVIANSVTPGYQWPKPTSEEGIDSSDTTPDEINKEATIETLFGPINECSVPMCESVIGMPAYFVDLIELLKDTVGNKHPNPIAVLKERRPDLFEIELSCANSETLMPYIDLVIEVLEDTVSSIPTEPEPDPPWFQDPVSTPAPSPSTGKPILGGSPAGPISKPQPETAAEKAFRQTTWPSEELIAFPEHLNLSVYETLSKAVFPWNLPFSLPHEEAEIYLCDLGVDRAEIMMRLRGRPNPSSDHSEALQLASAYLGITPAIRSAVAADASGGKHLKYWGHKPEKKPDGWPESETADLKLFLERTGLKYTDLIELLATDFINPDDKIQPVSRPDTDVCDLSGIYLTEVDDDFMDRFHRFVRLWRHLGCSVRELDHAVVVLGNKRINENFIINLGEAHKISDRLKLPLSTVLTFWGDIDTKASFDPGGKRAKHRPSQYDKIFQDKSKLSSTEMEILAFPFLITVNCNKVGKIGCAVIGLDAGDYAFLTAPLDSISVSEPMISETTGPLPLLSGIYRWITFARAVNLTIRELSRFQAMSGLDPFSTTNAALEFLDALDLMRLQKFSVDDLDFFLGHVSDAERTFKFNEECLRLLQRVRENVFRTGESPAYEEIRYEFEVTLVEEVARYCRLPSTGVSAILRNILNTDSDSQPDLNTLATLLQNWPETMGVEQVSDYVRLMKCCRLFARMNVFSREMDLEGDALQMPLQLFPPNKIPWKPEQNGPMFAEWIELSALVAVRDRLAAAGFPFWAIHEEVAALSSTDDEIKESWSKAARLIGEASLDTPTLIGNKLLALEKPAGTAKPSTWLRFLDAIDLVKRLGLSAKMAVRWAADKLYPSTSCEMRAAAAMKRGTEEWKITAPRLRNELREKQRDALLSWVAHIKEKSIDDLHGDYLVDLEMGSEQLTTRLALATASVQRFVQRILLGLENSNDKTVILPEGFADTWKWMQRYRTWSDCRKIFLFPENYLTSEIRDTKSPLYLELEQQLSMREMTDRSIEDAIGEYLRGLDEIARLEFMGSCIEKVDGEEILHIVARSHGVPHTHYHRTWKVRGGGFSPWVRLDLDIDGDWVAPIVQDGRMNLYWVKHTKQIEGMKDTLGLIPSRPFPITPHYPMYQDQYTLSWSTRKRNSWTAKRTANQKIARPFFPPAPAHFAVRLDSERLRIAGVTLMPPPPPILGLLQSGTKCSRLGSALIRVGNTVVRQVKEAGEAVVEGVQNVVEELGDVREAILDDDKNVLDEAEEAHETAIENIINLRSSIDSALEATAESGMNINESLMESYTKSSKGLLKDLLLIKIKKILINLTSLKNELDRKFNDLSEKIQDNLPPFVKDAINVLKNHVVSIKTTIEAFVRFITSPSDIPTHIAEAFVNAGHRFVADLGTVMRELWQAVKNAAGGDEIFGKKALNTIENIIGDTLEIRPGWAGPVPGLEFGFFEISVGGAKALRLTPPPFFGSAILGTGTAPAAAVGSLVASPGIITAPLAAVLLPALAALNESARLIYSLFPGYPAFHEVPVLSGVLSTDLPLMNGPKEENSMIRAWPGSGYFILPDSSLPDPSYCSIMVNLKQIAKEEWGKINLNDLNDLNGVLSDNLKDMVEKILNTASGVAESASDTVENFRSLFNVGMRVIRPVPFGPYPGRLYRPPPTIISEERNGRTFLLNRINAHKRNIWNVLSLYYPLSTKLNRAFDRDGVSGLYASGSEPNGEAWNHGENSDAKDIFNKTFFVIKPLGGSDPVKTGEASRERLDLSPGGAYSLYNWELFFHIPMLVAERFAAQQDFESTLSWYRKIFDPTASAGNSPQRYWKFKAFNDEYGDDGASPVKTIKQWLKGLSDGSNDEDQVNVVEEWQRDPFNPHLVARLRPGAYERSVVMRYVKTLINWGDARFRGGTWESINEATQLYLMARDILGPRPKDMQVRPENSLTYSQLEKEVHEQGREIDSFGNAWLTVESALPSAFTSDEMAPKPIEKLVTLSGMSMLYFGIPVNERLLQHWDTVEDRLFKIRQCLDIRGRVRSRLPDGIGLAENILQSSSHAPSVISHETFDTEMPLPAYRFQVMLQKAHEFAGDVRSFGAALLSAVEKRDAEALARLRVGHENKLLDAMKHIHTLRIEEAQQALRTAEQGLQGAHIRYTYYTGKEFMNTAETVKEVLSLVSSGLQVASGVQELGAAVMHALPNITFGAGGHGNTPNVSISYGSTQLGNALSAAARAFSLMSSVAQGGSAMAGAIAVYQRRKEDWNHQANLAENDIEQFNYQIAGAMTRLQIAQRENENHEKQTANAQEVALFMQEKFTNEELYEWMLNQASAAHFKSYMLAIDMARRAEACYHFERLPDESTFIQMEEWTSLGIGLLAGERLQQDIRRMETAYLESNTRKHEISKNISLAIVDPVALLMLQQNGECYVDFPEWLFDADHPGHYLRRLKTVSLSIPCVVGPNTSINCRLTLKHSRIRVSDEIQKDSEDEEYRERQNDTRFKSYPNSITSIATSTGQNDSGLFELNLRDERYLPFEGAGAISTWHIELPKLTNRFDFSSISDVIFHLRYTARYSGPEFREFAWNATFNEPAPVEHELNIRSQSAREGLRLFSARRDFPNSWHCFLQPPSNQADAILSIDLSRDRFPYWDPKFRIELTNIMILLGTARGDVGVGLKGNLSLLSDTDGSPIITEQVEFSETQDYPIFENQVAAVCPCNQESMGKWHLQITREDNYSSTAGDLLLPFVEADGPVRINSDNLTDVIVICSYIVERGH